MKIIERLKKTNQSGFSLIEVVVVIGMMTILAGVIVPNFTNYRTTADDTKIKTEMMNVYLGAETITNASDTKAQADAGLKITSGKNARLEKYTNIKDFTGYSFITDTDGNLISVRYTDKNLGSYVFNGNAERFMEKGRKSD